MCADNSDESASDGTGYRRPADYGILSTVRHLFLLRHGARPELRSPGWLGGLPSLQRILYHHDSYRRYVADGRSRRVSLRRRLLSPDVGCPTLHAVEGEGIQFGDVA